MPEPFSQDSPIAKQLFKERIRRFEVDQCFFDVEDQEGWLFSIPLVLCVDAAFGIETTNSQT